jgi:hypothetical protein
MVAEQKITLENGNSVNRIEKRGNLNRAPKKLFAKRD